ncbi:MAG: DUF5683 domain-containing protein [Pricia sp.]
MSKFLITLLLFFLFVSVCAAQEKDSIPDTQKREVDSAQNEEQEIDSLQNDLRKDGIIIVDTLKKKKLKINPLAPSKAAFYSAVFPGLGQIYNKRYWKAPIVWGLLGGAVAGYLYNDNLYQRYRTAFKRRQAGFIDDEFYDRFDGLGTIPNQDLGDLQTVQEARQRDRDLWLVGAIALYVLNIVDANVDAHLKQFNVDEDLSFDMQPFLDVDPITNQPNYGMAVVVKF